MDYPKSGLMNTKICSKCKLDKPLEAFSKDDSKNSGYYSSCRECVSSYVSNKVKKIALNNNKEFYQQQEGKLKYCSRCKLTKDIKLFSKNKCSKDGYVTFCKDCLAVYYSEKFQDLRNKVYNHYGKKCKFCGIDDIDVLAIDHVLNDGATERKFITLEQMYKKILKENFPNNYQVLCYNCNIKKYKTSGKWLVRNRERIHNV